ncbi:MAG: MarR family transcriptional regulator [Bacteroidetes bacterium]|nr:MAG: MarR family transcriptional regulator [Bacteroidota bacterium]
MKLSDLIQQTRFASPAQEAMLNIMVTSSWLTSELTGAMAPFGITPAQYNVLRILRGSHPRKLTCTDISRRLLDRTPDVTRLLNRLERSRLIHRARADHDRRVVEVGITGEGLALLERVDPVVADVQARIARHLSPEEHRQLSAFLERLRTDQVA